MNDVVAVPATKSGWRRTLRMKGMLVVTPRMRVSMSARDTFSAALLKSSAEPVTFISIES